MSTPRPLLLILAAQAGLWGCGDGVVTTAAGQGVTIEVIPPTAVVQTGSSRSFAAAVTGTANTAVTWTLGEATGCGTVLASGTYTAPGGAALCHVVATSVADPTKSASATVNVVIGAPGAVARPAWNTGIGFFVLKGKLYDPFGYEFVPKGFNINHYDQSWVDCAGSNCGLRNTGANVARIFDYSFEIGGAPTASMSASYDRLHSYEMAVEAVCTGTASGSATCSASTSTITACVDKWVSDGFYTFYKAREQDTLLNLGNEWGDCSATYLDTYRTQITRMRTRGYAAPIVLDAGNCGQGGSCIVKYGNTLQDHDPLHNVVFQLHPYSCDTDCDGYANLSAELTAIQAAQAANANPWGGFAFIIGEFGPKGAWSNTRTLIEQIAIFDSFGIGWMHWAWDDNGSAGCPGGSCFLVSRNRADDFLLQTTGPATGEPASCIVPGPCTTSPCNCTRVSTLSSYNGYELQASVLDPAHGLFYVRPRRWTTAP